MDHVAHLRREVAAFDDAVRRARGPAPVVVSCPGWSIADLVLHLGGVHRLVTGILRQRLTTAPNLKLMPASLLDWFTTGAAEPARLFGDLGPHERV